MKITADGLLGSAQKINSRKKIEEGDSEQQKKELKPDSVNIDKVVNSRIESIEKEIREIQTSLTRNQIINDGISQLRSALASGLSTDNIFENVTYNDRKILKEFMGSSSGLQDIDAKSKEVNNLINGDINSLTRVQIEMDNIIASDLAANKKVENLMKSVGDILKSSPAKLDNISNLDAQKVLKLVK